nr:MAG TPA: hypothetical protein [Caudoviricetes sp.]
MPQRLRICRKALHSFLCGYPYSHSFAANNPNNV